MLFYIFVAGIYTPPDSLIWYGWFYNLCCATRIWLSVCSCSLRRVHSLASGEVSSVEAHSVHPPPIFLIASTSGPLSIIPYLSLRASRLRPTAPSISSDIPCAWYFRSQQPVFDLVLPSCSFATRLEQG